MLCLSGFELYSRWVPLIIEVMSSYHWPYLPKRLNVKLDFIQLTASLRKKKCYRRTFRFQEANYRW